MIFIDFEVIAINGKISIFMKITGSYLTNTIGSCNKFNK